MHENTTSKESTFIFVFAGLVVGDEEGGGEMVHLGARKHG